MKIQDAYDIVDTGEPDNLLQYFCNRCDTDYKDYDTICCGKPVLMYHNSNMNTPYDEWILAGLIIREYELNRELDSVSKKIQDLADGSRY